MCFLHAKAATAFRAS